MEFETRYELLNYHGYNTSPGPNINVVDTPYFKLCKSFILPKCIVLNYFDCQMIKNMMKLPEIKRDDIELCVLCNEFLKSGKKKVIISELEYIYLDEIGIENFVKLKQYESLFESIRNDSITIPEYSILLDRYVEVDLEMTYLKYEKDNMTTWEIISEKCKNLYQSEFIEVTNRYYIP
jgi:hypothetical protein